MQPGFWPLKNDLELANVSGSCANECLAYLRILDDEIILIAVNLSSQAQDLHISLLATSLEGQTVTAGNDLYQPDLSHADIGQNTYQLSLPAYGFYMLPDVLHILS